MANSKAKKKRLKQIREHGKDVTVQRGQVQFSTHERLTKTKQESLNKLNKKHKRHFQNNDIDHLWKCLYYFFLAIKDMQKRVNVLTYLK